jgi:predicted nuclease of predicted toxin-antitoxin system
VIRFLADEKFNGYIVSGLRRRSSKIDLITTTEARLLATSDPELLDWAARENRAIVTHDVTTLIHFANERLRLNVSMSGVIEVERKRSD